MPHREQSQVELPSGAQMRVYGPEDASRVVLFASGGSEQPVPGDWSSSYTWLLPRLLPHFADVRAGWLKYRVKSWNRLEECNTDAREALDHLLEGNAESAVIVGFSMGGAVQLAANAGHERVTGMLGLAPWLPPEIPVHPLTGRRLVVIHGERDAPIPLFPGVKPEVSLAAVERARAAGIDAEWIPIKGGFHGWAVRPFGGRLFRLPRSGTWLRLIREQLRELVA